MPVGLSRSATEMASVVARQLSEIMDHQCDNSVAPRDRHRLRAQLPATPLPPGTQIHSAGIPWRNRRVIAIDRSPSSDMYSDGVKSTHVVYDVVV